MSRSLTNPALRAAAILALLWGAIDAARIGYADYLYRKDKLASVERAARVWPNPEFDARLADLDPDHALRHLGRAVALQPGDSKSWIQLGLRLEIAGDAKAAERCYLEAASSDRQFLPAWTLANFYARRQDAQEFWPWGRRAAQMSYDNARPLFRLAFGFTASAETVLQEMIPPRRKVEHEFLAYLLAEKLDASGIAIRMQKSANKDDVAPLLAWADQLILAGRLDDARDLWNSLSDRRLLPYPRLALFTNADFSQEPLQAGFDWRWRWPDGVGATRTGSGLRIEFSGRQPETFEVASQYLPVAVGYYDLSFEYRTAGLSATGLQWALDDLRSNPLPPAERWRHSHWSFRAGPVNRLVLLERRELGSTRPEGVVYLRGLSLIGISPDGEPRG